MEPPTLLESAPRDEARQFVFAPKHRLELDYAGWSGWPRYTCHTCEATLVRKPFHGDMQWASLVEKFKREHPVD